MMNRTLWRTGWAVGLVLVAATVAVASVGAPPTGEEVPVLPDVFVPYTPDGTDYILLVEKASQTLRVYAYEDRPREVARFSCSTGKSVGRKERDGDAKTPEGVYFFLEVHEDPQLSPIYGIRAFPTDYPNLMDRIAGRTGSAIWLHGTNKPLKDRDSNGCVAMENADLERVTEYISLYRTPIIIVDEIQTAPFEAGRETGQAVLSLVAGWAEAISGGDYHDYVDFYHPEFVPDITWWQHWRRLRREAPGGPIAAAAQDPMVFRHGDLLVALFELELRLTDGRSRVGAKKLFLRSDGDRFRIVGESFQDQLESREVHPVLLAASRLEPVPEPAPVPAGEAAPPMVAQNGGLSDAEIQSMVDGWLNAWSEMDIDTYGNYYARDFRSRGMDREGWLRYKDRLNQKYEFIRVTRTDLTTKPEGANRARVSFVQRYESDRYQGVGVKQLLLKREGGEWKIYRETFQKM